MKRFVLILIIILIFCISLVHILNKSAAPFLVKKPFLPPGYQKNNYTVQNIVDDSENYHCYYKFRDLKGNNIGWKWRYNKEKLDKDIATFGIPVNVLKNYWGTESQLQEIYTGLFHIREFKGNTTVFGVHHNAVVNKYYSYAEPIARLIKKTLADRDEKDKWMDRISLLLHFTQDIPYGRPADKYGDKYYYGFFPPPLCLIKAWGDCDTKAVLFCSILSHFPDYKLLTIDFPGHAAVAIKGIPRAYDTFTEYMGEQYILCEPVGPRHAPFGDSMYKINRIDDIFPIMVNHNSPPPPLGDAFKEDIVKSGSFKEKMDAALTFMENNQYAEAEKLFFELGLEYPGEYLPFYYLGEISKQGKDNIYKEYFNKAIEICIKKRNKDYTEYVHLGDMYFDLNDYKNAVTYYYSAYGKKNDSYYVLFRLGKSYYLETNYVKAIFYFKLADEQKPGNVVITYYLALSHIYNNQKDAGLPYLEAAFELDPHNIQVCTLLLDYCMRKLTTNKCRFYIDHILSFDNSNYSALFSRAQLYFFREEYQKALEIITMINTGEEPGINPILFNYWQGIILSSLHNGQAEEFFKKAVVQAKTVIEEGSATPDDYLFYGLAAAEIKEEVDKASVDIYNIMKKDRYNNYYYSLANAHLIERKKTPDSAIRFYDDAIKQYKKADEMMLLYLCYYYMERIYNTRKLELLIQDTSE